MKMNEKGSEEALERTDPAVEAWDMWF